MYKFTIASFYFDIKFEFDIIYVELNYSRRGIYEA